MIYEINDAISVNLIMLKKIKMKIYECMRKPYLLTSSPLNVLPKTDD